MAMRILQRRLARIEHAQKSVARQDGLLREASIADILVQARARAASRRDGEANATECYRQKAREMMRGFWDRHRRAYLQTVAQGNGYFAACMRRFEQEDRERRAAGTVSAPRRARPE